MRAPPRADAAAVALLVAAGLALRLAGIGQSLFGDEIFTYDIVVGASGPADVVRTVHDASITPPLHYLLAWASAQLGDPATTVRLPSAILGAATIPLVYALGRRTVSRAAALAGAAAFTIDPFALFYGSEARAYATLVFLVTASTLCLLIALETRRLRWWSLYAVLSAAALYTHYTAVFVLAAQAAWAVWVARDRWRAILGANAFAALLWLPWLPSYFHQRGNPGIGAIGALYDLDAPTLAKGLVMVVAGHPLVLLGDLPGPVALTLLAIGVAVGAIGALAGGVARPRPPLVLIGVLALATPAGLLLSQAAGDEIYAPRNLIASLPAACLALGALVTAPRGALSWAAIGAVGTALAIGAVLSLRPDARRTPWKDAAAYIDSNADPGDAVVQTEYFGSRDPLGRKPLLRSLQINLKRPHRFVDQLSATDGAAWVRAARGGGHVYATVSGLPTVKGLPGTPRLGPRLRLVERRDWEGSAPVSVLVYEVR